MSSARELELVEIVEKICRDIKQLEQKEYDLSAEYDQLEKAITELVEIRRGYFKPK